MGPPKAATAVREAVAMGCDGGLLLSDKAFAGSDTWATSYVLAAAIRKLGAFDLVICGERATDGDTGQVGPGIAGIAGPAAGQLRQQAGGDRRADLPRAPAGGGRLRDAGGRPAGVLTVVKEVADPRLPTLRGKQPCPADGHPRLGRRPTWTSKPTSSASSGSPTRVVKIFRPTVARQCRKLSAGDEQAIDDAADQLVQFLADRDLL